jgi:hypothetical protein
MLYIEEAVALPLTVPINDLMEFLVAASTSPSPSNNANLGMPQIWDSKNLAMNKCFMYLCSGFAGHATKDFWQKLNALFEIRRKNGFVIDDINIQKISNSLVKTAQSAFRATGTTGTKAAVEITVRLISDVEDEEARKASWKTLFIPRLHAFLEAYKADLEIGMREALSHGLFIMSLTRPSDFSTIWNEACESLIKLMAEDFEKPTFALASRRWMEICFIVLSLYAPGNLDAERLLFLTSMMHAFQKALDLTAESDGKFYDGILFMADLLQHESFVDPLFAEPKFKETRRALGTFVRSEKHAVIFLRSKSADHFLRVLLGLRKRHWEFKNVWKTIFAETIPDDRTIGVEDPSSLLAKVVSVDTPSLKEYIDSPTGLNMNLVKEMHGAMIKAARSKDSETEDTGYIDDLFVKLVVLRGTALLVVDALGVLVSEETTAALIGIVFRPEFPYERQILLITRLCEQDTKFAEFFLVHALHDPTAPSPPIAESPPPPCWDVEDFLWKLFRSRNGARYNAQLELTNEVQRCLAPFSSPLSKLYINPRNANK